MKKIILGATAMCFLLITGCGVSIFDDRTDAVYSPDGSVDSADIAISPDGNYYASHDPTHLAEIGIYQSNGTLVTTVMKIPDNTIKAYCWSANSELLAVMYYGEGEDGVFILDAMTGHQYSLYLVMKSSEDVLDRVPIDDDYHFLVFEEGSNGQLLAAISVDGKPGLVVRLDQFEVIEDIADPRITLEPPNPMTLQVGETFVDPGVFAYDEIDGYLTVKSDADDAVDTSTIGTYVITYTVEDSSGNVATTTRTVYVVDTTSPVVTILGDDPDTTEAGQAYVDPGATALDNYDGALTPVSDANASVDTDTLGSQTVTYTAIDSSNNIGTATREVIVVDTTPPVSITVLGDNPLYSPVGDALTDPGATSYDAVDGDLTVVSDWGAVVDINTADAYVVTYTATDSSGNSISVIRDVHIENLGVIITEVPEYGSTTDLYGRVTGLRPEDAANYRIAVTIQVEGNWWTKPTSRWPTRIINSDGTWYCAVVTGGNDQYADKYVAHLIPASFTPPTCVPCSQMPDYAESIDYVLVDRTPPPIILTAFGYDWGKKDSLYRRGPGPNYFSADNVWKDEFGRVHLKMAYNNDSSRWECSEIMGLDSFGYKTYVVETTGRLDILDPNVVFAPMFTWEDGSSVSGNREIDPVEITRWGVLEGNPVGTNAQGVIQPCSACPGCSDNCDRYTISLTDSEQDITVYMVWGPGQVETRTYLGHHLGSVPPSTALIHQWVTNSNDIPTPGNETIHMNLWLMSGLAPIDDQDVEMIINNFAVLDNPPAWDMMAPVISILGDNPATTEAKETYVDAGATATDVNDGDLTSQIQVTSTVNTDALANNYTVTYTVTDSSNNTTTAIRTVQVTDTTPPVLTLVGGDMTVEVYDPYVDPGYEASDTLEGNLTTQVVVTSVTL